MNRRVLALLLVTLLFLTAAPAALASVPDDAVGSCPRGFHIHEVGTHDHHEHDGEMAHQHVGLDSDLNGDGYWCVKHITTDEHIHLHIDNYLPLR